MQVTTAFPLSSRMKSLAEHRGAWRQKLNWHPDVYWHCFPCDPCY